VGFGGAALIGGFITLALRGVALSDLERECGKPIVDGVACEGTGAAKDASDNGKAFSTLTTVLLPVGGVLAAAGIGLVIWGSNSEEPAATAQPRAELRIVPGPARLDAVLRF
jgi:hypothetical protein